MRNRTSVAVLAFAIATAATASCGSQPASPGPAPTSAPPASVPVAPKAVQPPAEPKPAPKPGTPAYLLANQPDFTAEFTYTSAEDTLSGTVARKGQNLKLEYQPKPAAEGQPAGQRLVRLDREGKPALMISPDLKIYTEIPPSDSVSVLRLLERVQQEPDLVIEEAGAEKVDGHMTTKLKLRVESKDVELIAFLAKDLKNLVIKMEGRLGAVPTSFALSKVKLGVPDGAFDLPPDFEASYANKTPVQQGQPPAPPGAPQ